MPLRLLFLLPILLLVSCIDGDEEIWLERDGSGRIEAVYRMPPMIMNRLGSAPALQEKLEDAIAKEPTIRIRHIGHRSEEGRVVFEFGADFDDVRTLATFPRRRLRDPAAPDIPVKEEALFGQMNLEVRSLALSFDREVDLSTALPQSAIQNPGMLGESAFRYTVHLPASASRHNATSTSNNGRTLHWEFLLRKHTDAPMSILMKAPLPIPWWVWFTVFLLVLVFLLMLIWAAKYTIAMRR
jgi:hypothetical protein